MSFVQKCIQDSLPIWKQCLESEFLQKLETGFLQEECFKGYIIEDSLYLREYAKVFAWGILHAEEMEEIRTYYSLLSFVNESEDSTRRYYLRRYQLEDAAVQKLPLRPQNQAYLDVMLHAAKNAEGVGECMMAALPCMLSYGWIFKEMLRRRPAVLDTVYGPFVKDYAGERYEKLCQSWIEYADKACADLSPKQQEKCMNIFRACSQCELHFWEMSGVPRADI